MPVQALHHSKLKSDMYQLSLSSLKIIAGRTRNQSDDRFEEVDSVQDELSVNYAKE